MDELSPLFHDIEFNERFRGYDVEEVDAYVDRVAKAAALVQGRIAELQERVAAAEAQPRTVVASSPAPAGELDDARLSRVLVLAQRTADAAIEEAKAEAEAMRIDASADAERMRREADDHASLVLAEAETDRRRMITEAEEAAAGAVDAERARVAGEVAELEQHRAVLSDDIAILEQHLAEARLSVAASLSTLTDLLEAPESFRTAAAPTTSGIEVPQDLLEGRPRPSEAADEPTDEHHLDVVAEAAPVIDDPAEPVTAEPAMAESVAAIVEDEAAGTTVDEPAELSTGTVDAVPAAMVSDDEPTQVFETIPFEPLVDDDFSPPVVDVTFEPPAPAVDVAAMTSEAVVAETGAESAVEDDPTRDEVEVEPSEADLVASEGIETATETEQEPVDPEPNLVFDIDLVDAEHADAIVDLTDLPNDVPPSAEPDRMVDSDRSNISNADGEGATATAPPRLVTAADIEATDVDEQSDASAPAAAQEEPDLLFAPPESTANDHFLDQLRDAVGTGEGDDFGEDALAAFFDEGEDGGDSRGWFNRRR